MVLTKIYFENDDIISFVVSEKKKRKSLEVEVIRLYIFNPFICYCVFCMKSGMKGLTNQPAI